VVFLDYVKHTEDRLFASLSQSKLFKNVKPKPLNCLAMLSSAKVALSN